MEARVARRSERPNAGGVAHSDGVGVGTQLSAPAPAPATAGAADVAS